MKENNMKLTVERVADNQYVSLMPVADSVTGQAITSTYAKDFEIYRRING